MTNKIKRRDSGFTLIELMTVMAIIAILATAIIMSLSSHKKRAEGSKALTELSGIMQNIYLCIADDGTINNPTNAGNAICDIGAEYGSWPSLSESLSGYVYASSDFAIQPWYYSATKAADSVVVCCNSTSGRCQKFEDSPAHTCTEKEALK
jgi:prepilin-type N-terminal cleavage/methylation domain-containing protein